MKTRFKQRHGTQEVKADKGTDKASGRNMDDIALNEDVNSQDEGIIIEGKTTSEPSDKQVRNEVQEDEEAAMPSVGGEEQNLNVIKKLKKRKLSADVEIAITSPTDKCSSRLRPRKEVPSFQMVDLNENDIVRIVGMRIRVYWPDSRKWFAGRIKSFNREKMLHTVNYDDGDIEELDLKKEKFELEVKPKDGFHIKTELRSRKSKKYLSGHVVVKTSFSQKYVNAMDNADIEGESKKDLGGDVVANLSFSQEYSKVILDAEPEGENKKDLSGDVVANRIYNQECNKVKDNCKIEGESKKDLGVNVVSSTSSNQEYDKVKHNAEIEGQGPKTAVSKEDMESNPGKQQPADHKSEKDENEVHSARQIVRFNDVGGSRKHRAVRDAHK